MVEIRICYKLVEPHFLNDQRTDAARYQKLAGVERASNDLQKIVAAAHYCRIEFLFVKLGVQVWGEVRCEDESS